MSPPAAKIKSFELSVGFPCNQFAILVNRSPVSPDFKSTKSNLSQEGGEAGKARDSRKDKK
jgi:hypothetical protein